MFWACRQIASPFSYLRIHHDGKFLQTKAVYDWIFPIALALLTVALLIGFAPHIRIFTESGVLAPFQKLLEILLPFYIVALAAVATFAADKLDAPTKLDAPMKGRPVTLKMRRSDGEDVEYPLTRRQFICYLFGYLSAASLIWYVAVLVLGLIAQSAGEFFVGMLQSWYVCARVCVLFVLLLPIWQILIATLLGIYFMSDRLHLMDEPGF